MKIVKRLSETGASEAELSQLERQTGSTLPSDYRQFMSDWNGGRPDPRAFVFNTTGGQSDCAVRYFLTLNENEQHYFISDYLNRFKGRIPQKLLPIACDSFGNLVLLDLGAKSHGAVYFWDHEEENESDDEDDDEPTWDNVSVVAPSFAEFLNILE